MIKGMCVGEYIGLTGARLDGAEMVAMGLATHFVPSQVLTSLKCVEWHFYTNGHT